MGPSRERSRARGVSEEGERLWEIRIQPHGRMLQCRPGPETMCRPEHNLDLTGPPTLPEAPYALLNDLCRHLMTTIRKVEIAVVEGGNHEGTNDRSNL